MLLIKPLLAFRPNKLDWIFASKTFIAGMLALYIAFELNLSYPIWAIGTVFVIANPYSGMMASKSIYRILGTLIGAIFAIAVMPHLVNTPWLFTFEPYRVCRRVNILRDYADEKTKLYPRN